MLTLHSYCQYNIEKKKSLTLNTFGLYSVLFALSLHDIAMKQEENYCFQRKETYLGAPL